MTGLKRRPKNMKGQSSVEAAFALLISLALVMFLWDGVNLGYNWVCMQFVLGRGLQEVQMGHDEATAGVIIHQDATSLGINTGLQATVTFGQYDWFQGPRSLATITLQRTVPFGPFLKVVFNAISLTPQVTLKVKGYTETPPS